MRKNIGYHTRLYNDNTKKITGGSFAFDGEFNTETIQRLVNDMFSVVIKPSGVAVFLDRSGREVSLYVSVDAKETVQGKQAILDHRRKQSEMSAKEELEQKERIEELDSLMGCLSHDEIVKRLRGN